MKNLHNIFLSWDKDQVKILWQFGVKAELGYFSFWLEENETYWQLKPYFDKWGVQETIISKFSDEEKDAAKQLVFLSPWANGYPMPDNDGGYRKATYDDSDYCNTCGRGLKQKEPFRLKKAPNWSGHKKMFSLNWIFDEFFVRKDVYESLFKPIGIKSEKVLLYKKETVIDDTVQLIIPEMETSLTLEGYPFLICKDCNRKRYDLINKGFFPSFKDDVKDIKILKSKEWFGSGASARKYIFVSQALRRKFVKHGISANYIPCGN